MTRLDRHGRESAGVARQGPGKADGMRLLFLLIALVVVVVVADGLISREAEDRGAQALRDELTTLTGQPPDRVDVELDGWLAGSRLLAGPAPDATATVRGLRVPGTAGSLTRLRVDLDEVHAGAGELLDGSGGELPFTARRGTFRAVLDEDDLNQVVGASQSFERLAIEGSGIAAIPPATTAGVREPVPMTTELGRGTGGGDSLVLRPEPTEANRQALGPLLAASTLTIPFVLPDAMDLREIETRSGRLTGTGTVDVEALVAGSESR